MALSIAALGVGSGLNLSSLLDNLRIAEQARLEPVEGRLSSYKLQLSSYGALMNALGALEEQARVLSSDTFYSMLGLDYDDTHFKASLGDGAQEGRYRLDIQTLARAHTIASQGKHTIDEPIAAGGRITLSLCDDQARISEQVDIDIDEAECSLIGLRSAINSAGIGIQSSIINDGSDTPYRLMLMSRATGTDHQIDIKVQDWDPSSPLLSRFLDFSPAQSPPSTVTETPPASDDVDEDADGVEEGADGVDENVESTGESGESIEGDGEGGNGSLDDIGDMIGGVIGGGDNSGESENDGSNDDALEGDTGSVGEGGTVDPEDDRGMDGDNDNDDGSGLEQDTGRMFQTVAAQDARLTINGLSVTRHDNVVSDAIQGVTLSLNSVSERTQWLTIAPDADVVGTALEGLVKAYNQFRAQSNAMTDLNGSVAGSMTGNGTLRRLENQLIDALQGVQSGPIPTLSQLGVELSDDGLLSVDRERLSEVVGDQNEAIEQFMLAGDSIFSQIHSTLQAYTGEQGILAGLRDSARDTIEQTTARLVNMQRGIDQVVDRYRIQFQELDKAMAMLSSTQAYLEQQLNAINDSDA